MQDAFQFRFGSIEFWILIIVIVAIFILVPGLLGAPWFPTKNNTVRKMLSMAEINPNDVVYDLGSGDGRIILMAAKEFHARSIGIEVNPLWVFWTRWRICRLNLEDHMDVVWKDFFREDLGDADVVTLYLSQLTNDSLQRKLEKELKPGARVISNTFTFDGWRPINADNQAKIHVYEIGNHRMSNARA
jgi:SAM-dependent methyltransferase